MALDRRGRLVLFTLLALLAVGAVVAYLTWGKPLLSSGPLSRFHASLDTEAGCAECHVARAGLDGQLCLACHEPLARRIEQKQGYHAGVTDACDTCHREHLGRDARLIRWPEPGAPFKPASGKKEEFPHASTGFALEGAHAKLKCEDCHKQALQVDAAVIAFMQDWAAGKRGEPPGPVAVTPEAETYLGLGKDCASCHADAHAPTFGQDCAKCHDAAAWRPSPSFDHAQTRYPLVGEHAKVACEKCHLQPPPAEPPPSPRPPVPTFAALRPDAAPRPFRGVGFGAPPAEPVQGDALPGCRACHANAHRKTVVATSSPHGTGFGRCEDCHAPHGFKNAGAIAQGATFDHARVGFALDGAHAQVKCADCHGPDLDRAPRTSCKDCHEDVHKGAFDREVAAARTSCDLCHRTAAWKPSSYVDANHPLPLIEGHAVKCESCHGEPKFPRLPARGGAPAGPLDQSCKACHEDVHQGKLSQDCASCHGFKSFHLAELDAAGHAELGFPLRDAHAKVTCEGCHGARNAEGGLRTLALAEARTQGCVACHTDVHRDQLAQDCQSCHTEAHFVPSTFDEVRHRKARLPLQGAHRAVPCEACHVKDLPPEPLAQRFHWEGRALRCDACHQKDDPHRGQFEGQDCTACHLQEGWAPSTFGKAQHARMNVPLDGPHDRACATCHQVGGAPGFGDAVVFKGTPRECAGCHLDPHQGQFAGRGGEDGCGNCHGPLEWKPSRFDHQKSRFPLEGAHARVDCSGCHVSVNRQTEAGPRPVVHYFPIEERACDDCHDNPHAAPATRPPGGQRRRSGRERRRRRRGERRHAAGTRPPRDGGAWSRSLRRRLCPRVEGGR